MNYPRHKAALQSKPDVKWLAAFGVPLLPFGYMEHGKRKAWLRINLPAIWERCDGSFERAKRELQRLGFFSPTNGECWSLQTAIDRLGLTSKTPN